MPDPIDEYSLADLCRIVDVTPRTVRYYVAQGLLPAPSGAGPAARYGQGHLARLRLIRKLQRQHMPLADIRTRLAVLSDEDVRGLVEAPSGEPAADDSALDYIRSILRSVEPADPAPSARVPVPPTQAQLRAYTELRTAAEPAGHAAPESTLATTAVSAATRPADGEALAMREPARDDAEPAPTPQATESLPQAHTPLRSQWDRVELTPDVELHIRRPLSRIQNRRVERLIAIARELLEED